MGSNLGQSLTNLNHIGHQRASRKEAKAEAGLLEQLLMEQRRTNELLEWVGGLLAQREAAPRS